MKDRIAVKPVSGNLNVIRKDYRVLAKYSLDTGNALENIGPEACTHLVSFWQFLSPLFETVFKEGIEPELRKNPEFCALTEDQQRDVINKKWTDYVRKNHILQTPHSWALDKNEEG